MKISVFGLGYVGCVSVGCLSNFGHEIIGVDKQETKVKLINSGKPTIIEQNIDKLIDIGWKNKLISGTVNPVDAVVASDISFIAVGTPSTPEGHLNLSYIYNVAEEIGLALIKKDSFHIIVIRSTVLPGTNHKIGQIIETVSAKKRNHDFAIVSNPEFLREGSAVKDYFNPPVTVLGTDNHRALETMVNLYKEINAPIEKVSIEEAEIIKYVNNSFHALKITFANEVGNICKKLNIDSHKVMEIFCMDTQLNLSPYYLKPGFAYGGSCLPKDLKGLKTLAHDNYLESPILNSIENSNSNQKRIAIQQIEKYGKKKIGILGLSFKAGTDDLRYSPIVEVAEHFLGKGYQISIFDENVNLSKLTGTNKEYIDLHIPHLSNLITDKISQVIFESEVIIITHKLDEVESYIEEHPNKYFFDLVGINNRNFDNYQGICW